MILFDNVELGVFLGRDPVCLGSVRRQQHANQRASFFNGRRSPADDIAVNHGLVGGYKDFSYLLSRRKQIDVPFNLLVAKMGSCDGDNAFGYAAGDIGKNAQGIFAVVLDEFLQRGKGKNSAHEVLMDCHDVFDAVARGFRNGVSEGIFEKRPENFDQQQVLGTDPSVQGATTDTQFFGHLSDADMLAGEI